MDLIQLQAAFTGELAAVNRKLRTLVDDRARDMGLTLSRARLLMELAKADGPIQSDLAGLLDIEQPTLVRLLDGLERNGMIERRAVEGDRRARRVFLTETARAQAQDILSSYHDSPTYLPCPAPHGRSTFALRVKGDSMTAPYGRSYPDGCIIYVDPERRSPVNGDRIVACLVDTGDHEVTFKIYKNEDGRQWLAPLNTQHPPLFERFTVLGTVIGKWEDG